MIIPIIIIVSFALDSIISNIINIHGLFAPLLTLMSLIIIYPYYNGNKSSYYKAAFITGLFYDLIYTDTMIVHAIIFTLMAFIITKLNVILAGNWLNDTIIAVICIIIYRLVMYGLLLINGNIELNTSYILESIYSSLILNIIYIIIVFNITDKISTKLKIRKSYWFSFFRENSLWLL